MDTTIANLRKNYTLQGLSETEANHNPFIQFQRWFDQALAAQLPEPNAMTIATTTPDGKPSARMVLLKDFDEGGFVFFTNYNSYKGQELAENPQAALVFWWAELERQVRICGAVEELQVKYENQSVPRPPHWGGLRVIPTEIEFWQGRPSRLHDRLLYTRLDSGSWKIERLSP